MERDGQLVRFQIFAVTESLALKPLQFQPDGQECAAAQAAEASRVKMPQFVEIAHIRSKKLVLKIKAP
jgi:hypothetical protein